MPREFKKGRLPPSHGDWTYYGGTYQKYDGYANAWRPAEEWERLYGKTDTVDTTHEPVNHPKHYTSHPSGVECITITEHMNFNLGNALKYIWRADLKDDPVENLKKAQWYLARELARLEAAR